MQVCGLDQQPRVSESASDVADPGILASRGATCHVEMPLPDTS